MVGKVSSGRGARCLLSGLLYFTLWCHLTDETDTHKPVPSCGNGVTCLSLNGKQRESLGHMRIHCKISQTKRPLLSPSPNLWQCTHMWQYRCHNGLKTKSQSVFGGSKAERNVGCHNGWVLRHYWHTNFFTGAVQRFFFEPTENAARRYFWASELSPETFSPIHTS